jgi:hypothetical protein
VFSPFTPNPVEERRYIVCLNEEERRKDARDREAIVAHLKEQLPPSFPRLSTKSHFWYSLLV